MKLIKHLPPLMLGLISMTACSSTSTNYTLMTYNIRHGIGMDRVLDLDRIVNVINAVDPDIIVLNEMDHGTVRSFGVYQTDSLGRQLEMYSQFGRSIDYDGGEYGNALLSKYPILDFRIIDLSTDSLLEGRSVFIASLDIQPDTLIVMGTHLGLLPEERHVQMKRIIAALPQSHQILLAGDFNFEPDADTYHVITEYLSDSILELTSNPEHTFPADKPDRRIDYIFIGRDIQPLKAPHNNSKYLPIASDHLPQTLEFKIR